MRSGCQERSVRITHICLIDHSHTANVRCFRKSRTLPQVEEPPLCALYCQTTENVHCLIVLFYIVIEHFGIFGDFQNKIRQKRPSCHPCHKSPLAIGDNFIGFSFLCVSNDSQPKHFTPNIGRLKKILHLHMRGYFLKRRTF